MLENLSSIIVTGLISCSAFEIVKYLFICIKNRIEEHSLSFNISGYWAAFHERDDYSAYEFLIIKQFGDRVEFKLYQKTNDNRFHMYKGLGFIRESKVSLAYQEANDHRSNSTGTFNFKIYNISEHSLGLTGRYTEFSENESECSSYPYKLAGFSMSPLEIFCISILRKNYIKRLMNTEEFKNVCNSKMP